MFKHQKWVKRIALAMVLLLSLSVLAGCQSGRNYSDELKGDASQIPVTQKFESVDVPYTGPRPVTTVKTNDPFKAGLVDREGNLLNGGGKVDLRPFGIDNAPVVENIIIQPDNNTNQTPSTNVPETNVPETNVPETNVPETNVPETNVPETNVPETNEPETNAPETNEPETNVPETNEPETNVPETNVPETNEPETNVPETNEPEQQPEGNEPEQQPEGNEPEAEDPYAAMKADKSGTKIRFMCQNIRYDADADKTTDNAASIRRYRFKALVEKYDPDVICVQEACSSWTTALAQDLGDKYDMYYHFREPVSGSDESCPVLWKKDKYEKLAEGNFWLSDTPDKSSASFVEGYYPRVANWVKLKDKSTGSIFTVHSTHFGFGYTDEHRNKIRQLFAKNFQKNSDGYNFMMGDWNIYYDSVEYYQIANMTDIIDMRVVAMEMQENGHSEIGDFRTGTSNGFLDENRDGGDLIDFITAQPAKHMTIDYYTSCYEWLGVPEMDIKEGWVSDHFAQVADIRIDTDISYAEYYPDTAK